MNDDSGLPCTVGACSVLPLPCVLSNQQPVNSELVSTTIVASSPTPAVLLAMACSQFSRGSHISAIRVSNEKSTRLLWVL